MRIFAGLLNLLFVILHIYGVTAEAGEDGKGKYVLCNFEAKAALEEDEDVRFFPEDLDLTICTHLMYSFALIGNNLEIEERYHAVDLQEEEGLGLINRTVSLKNQKPGLEVFIDVRDSFGALAENVRTRNRTALTTFSNNAISYIQRHGFDGMNIRLHPGSLDNPTTEGQDVFFSTVHEEFQRHDIKLVVTVLPEGYPREAHFNITEPVSRNLDLIIVASYWTLPKQKTEITSSPREMERVIDGLTGAGVPAEKLLVAIPAFTFSFRLCDREHREVNVQTCGVGTEGIHVKGARFILYSSEFMRKMANTSEDWVITKDHESNMLHADSKSLLWASYEDNESIRQKAAFVLERNLAGVAVVLSNMEDFKGLYTGDGMTFPITRIAYNALNGQ